MEVGHAWRVLGLDPCDGPRVDQAALRAAFAQRLFALHPDHSDAPDATAATIELTEAYQTASNDLGAPPGAPSAGSVPPPAPAPNSTPRSAPTAAPTREVVAVAQLSDDTIGIGAPGPETYRLLLEAAHELGEVIYVEP